MADAKTPIISCKYRNEVSFHGHSLDELKSGLQKYIRRSIHDKALYCASELDLFADAGHEGERIRTNFIHRLMIIFMEDVGIGGLNLWPILNSFVEKLLNSRKMSSTNRDRKMEINVIRQWIYLLASKKCKKSRSCSHLNNIASLDSSSKDEAMLKNTPLENIYKNIVVTDNQETLITLIRECLDSDNPIKRLQSVIYANNLKDKIILFDILRPYVVNLEYIKIGQLWYKEIHTKEQFMCWNLILSSILFGSDNVNKKLEDYHNRITETTWDDIKAMPKLIFDDFVLDKHVRCAKNNTLSYFGTVSSIVIPESEKVNPWLKWFYMKRREVLDINNPKPLLELNILHKINLEIILKESEYAEFKFRAQLTTSAAKTDVYIAVDPANGKCIVVKGPFKDDKVINQFLEHQKLKQEYGLPIINSKLVYLIPDRWAEGVPLGYRNKVIRTLPAPFLVSDSLIPLSKFITKIHSSKLWSETLVIDLDKTDLSANILTLKEQALLDYYGAIAYRIKHKLSDLATRNFLHVDGRVYSIDEESVNENFNLLSDLKKEKYNFLKENWNNNNNNIDKTKIHPELKIILDKEFLEMSGTKKTKKDADSNTLILFYSHTPSKSGVLGVECFSQFYPTPNFTIDNIKFPTSEHFFHYMKAKLFGDAKIMKEMLLEKNSDPAKAKKLGRKVVPFDEKVWTENAYKIVVEGNFHKFSQNEDLKKVLLDTKDAILAEASPKDAIWGIGMSKSNKDAKDPSKWQGTNLLGKALMEVRHRLIGGAGGEHAGDDMAASGGSGTAGPAGPAGGRTRSSSPPPSSASDVVLHPYLVNVNNRSNDFNTFINHLLLGIYENDKHRQIIVSDKYLKIWESVFSGSDSVEKNDILGEKLYSCALVKLIYAQRNGSITPSEISNMNIYFSSSAFLETIAVRLGFEKWNKTTPPSGLVSTFKRFIFTLEYISDLIRDDYRKVGDFETAASMPSGFTVVERFIDTYFKVTNEDFIKAVRKPAKTFIIQISDLFNFKGRWAIVQSSSTSSPGRGEDAATKKYYTFKIYDKELVSQKILETFFGKRPNLKDKERYANARRIINEELDSSGSDDETKLANEIAEKINSFGLTYDWLEKYRNVLRIENIPESLKNLLKDTIKNLGYDSVIFEYSESHSHEERKSGVKIGVVIMFGVKNVLNGNGATKHLLFTDSGEIFNENYTFLKNKTIESWIKSLASA